MFTAKSDLSDGIWNSRAILLNALRNAGMPARDYDIVFVCIYIDGDWVDCKSHILLLYAAFAALFLFRSQ